MSIDGFELWLWLGSEALDGWMDGVEMFGCIGRPISVPAALLVRLVLPVVACVARLNMCGMRALLSELALCPSGGWNCWKDSNSVRRELRLRRNSSTVEALDAEELWEGCTSSTAGTESPRRR